MISDYEPSDGDGPFSSSTAEYGEHTWAVDSSPGANMEHCSNSEQVKNIASADYVDIYSAEQKT